MIYIVEFVFKLHGGNNKNYETDDCLTFTLTLYLIFIVTVVLIQIEPYGDYCIPYTALGLVIDK